MYIPLTSARTGSRSISWAKLYLSLIFTKYKKEILDKILSVGEISRKEKTGYISTFIPFCALYSIQNSEHANVIILRTVDLTVT